MCVSVELNGHSTDFAAATAVVLAYTKTPMAVAESLNQVAPST